MRVHHPLLLRGLTLALLFAGLVSGCRAPEESSGAISEDTFVEYCAVILRAQEDAAGDLDALRRALDAQPLPENWRERAVAFADQNSLSVGEWVDLISWALDLAGEPSDP